MDQSSVDRVMNAIDGQFGLVSVATGILSPPGATPKKSLAAIEARAMAEAICVNAIGPALALACRTAPRRSSCVKSRGAPGASPSANAPKPDGRHADRKRSPGVVTDPGECLAEGAPGPVVPPSQPYFSSNSWSPTDAPAPTMPATLTG